MLTLIALAEKLDLYAGGDEFQRPIEQAAAFIRAAALAREQEAQPARYWSIADDANKCIHKPHCLATSKEMQALRLKALEEAQPAAQEPRMEDLRALSAMALNPPTREEAEAEDVSDVDPAPLLSKLGALRAAQPAAQEPSMRHILLIQIHNLIDLGERYAASMQAIDPDEQRYAEGAVDHARKVVEPYNYNGPDRAQPAQPPKT